MIEITQHDYLEVARKLIDEIGAGHYFNGSVEYVGEAFCSTLTATLIVYRDPSSSLGIADIVPVWWEFLTADCGGELPNDFSFSTLKDYIFE